MLNLISRYDFQNSLAGAFIFGCGCFIYYLYQKKLTYKDEIKFIQSAKIYEFQEFVDSHMKRENLFSDTGNQKYEKSLLVKVVPSKSVFTSYTQNVYSNQIYICAPSQDYFLQKCLKEYHKKLTPKSVKISDFNFNRANLFESKILTDRIFSKINFIPEQKYLNYLNARKDKDFLEKFIDFFNISQIIYKMGLNISYYIQKIFQIFSYRKEYQRSKDKGRNVFFKGVLAGALSLDFIFLQDAYFLLKLRVQDNQVFSQLVADNKIMMIDFYKRKIMKLNVGIISVGCIMLIATSWLAHRFQRPFKKWWKRMTEKQKYLLDLKSVQDNKLCQICYYSCRNVLFYKCRHLIVCEDCYWHLDQKKCIICNEQIEKAQTLCTSNKNY